MPKKIIPKKGIINSISYYLVDLQGDNSWG
jgi:hypothetical protein